MIRFLQFISDKFLAKRLDFRVRLFNVLAMAGMTIGIVMAVLGVFTNAGFWNILANIIAAALAFCLLYYSYKSGKYQQFYMFTTIIIFLIFFPVLFFTGGGYHSGMPSFFVFAVLFTVFMLESKKIIVMAVIEMLVYIGICLTAYKYPQSVHFFETEQEFLMDIIIGFTSVSLALGVTLYLHFRMYNKQQRELEAARVEALRFSKAKSNFLANMSHEIRTPINVMLGMNEVIIREKGSERIRGYSLNIQNAGKTLLALIDNILDMSKIESGKLEIISENYQTGDLIDDLAMIGMERVSRHGIEFMVQADENLPCGLIGDFLHIKQVVVNFLSNAAKYTEQGSVTLSFDQKPGKVPDEIHLCISVSDTGIGIKEENIALLFDAFNRGELPAHRYVEGTGLGLAIAKNFADLMQGHIDVKSRLGHGSVFSVEIPQKVHNKTPLRQRTITAEEETAGEGGFIAPGGNVLVVDDSAENLLVVKSLLSRTLLQVDTVISGEECIKAVSKKRYHAILMDYMMPDMDGIDTLRALKEIPGFDTPVVAVTANVVAEVKETLLNAGFVEYLSKPIMWKDLEETLMGILPSDLIMINNQSAQNLIPLKIKKKLTLNAEVYGIILEEGLSYLSGDILQYKNLAIFFVENYDKSKLEATKAEAQKDWQSLKFTVHSLKSKARAVGAVNLSITAAKVEKQCMEENDTYIEVTLPILYYEWSRAQEGLKQLVAGLEELPNGQKIETENTGIGMDELLMLLKNNRQPDALAALERMIALSHRAETIERLQDIRQKVDEIEFREAERLLIGMGGDAIGR
ncbi:ATP-binding protein [Anaerovorax odorimutans]|uniref:ATP-binding protein n=1 Tax=Anaerovorax odorimutans TaxID=109327 RepID=UPI0003FDF92F|nr:ATP-binding protein [Anaerovorax odorimutans]